MAEQPIIEREPTDPRKREKVSPLLKFALEMGPGLVFLFVTLRGAWLTEKFPALAAFGEPILLATAFFMAATAISLSVSWVLTRSLPVMPLVSAVVVFVFGALALYLQDKVFAFMKPTIINALFGAVLLGGLVFKRSLLAYVFDSAFSLDAEGWRKLSFRWGLFFFFLAVLNEVIWRNFTEEFWALFKVVGVMPITLLFTLTQLPLIMRHTVEEKPEA